MKKKTSSKCKCDERDPRSGEIRRMLSDPVHPRMIVENKIMNGEIVIDSSWSINCSGKLPEMVKVAALDLKIFLKEAFNCHLSSGKDSGKNITVRIKQESVNGKIRF